MVVMMATMAQLYSAYSAFRSEDTGTETQKTVPEMTYNVLSGTLLYHTVQLILFLCCRKCYVIMDSQHTWPLSDLLHVFLCMYMLICRLSGSYEALAGGLMSEALTDVTGGIVERFELGSKASSDLQNIMLKAYKKSSLMGCSIDVINV